MKQPLLFNISFMSHKLATHYLKSSKKMLTK